MNIVELLSGGSVKTVKTLGKINIFEKVHISQNIFTKKLKIPRKSDPEKIERGLRRERANYYHI